MAVVIWWRVAITTDWWCCQRCLFIPACRSNDHRSGSPLTCSISRRYSSFYRHIHIWVSTNLCSSSVYVNDVHDASRLCCVFFRNFLFAPSSTNSYEFSTFTGIRDAFAKYLKTRSVASSNRENEASVAVEQQISMVTLAIQSAYSILSEDEYFQWLRAKVRGCHWFSQMIFGCNIVVWTRKDVAAKCRHDMRPSVQLPSASGSGADSKLGLKLVV